MPFLFRLGEFSGNVMQRRDFLLGVSAMALAGATKPASAAMDEFVSYDGMGQAALVRNGEVSSLELSSTMISSNFLDLKTLKKKII